MRFALGGALVGLGLAWALATTGDVSQIADGLAAALILIVGVALVVGPWLLGLLRELTDERRERIRSQERAELAAHVHDSVLQTLTLIQRNADDPQAVGRLARAEERALRGWLYRPESVAEGMLAASLERLAGEVEDTYAVTIEVVAVGDAPVDEAVVALLQAVREAMVNAAKHAGAAGPVAVYAEVGDDVIEVFVRDRGTGFDVDDVPEDRLGVRQSIIGRMERNGGRAELRSSADGTEVRLTLPRRTERKTVMTDRPTVVLVDDHRMFRTGVQAELGATVEVVGEAEDVASAVRVILATRPAVVLLDVHLPDGSGADVVRACAADLPETQFLALSVSDAAEDVISVIRAGARGYVTKSISGAELTAAIHRVAGGDVVFSPRLAGFVLDAFAGLPGRPLGRRGPRPAHPARARGAAPHRARLRLQGGGQGAVHLGEDRRDPRLLGPAQAAALQPPRADPLGHRPPPALRSAQAASLRRCRRP